MVIHKIRELQSRGLRLGLLTNNIKEFGEHWRSTFPIDERVELVKGALAHLDNVEVEIFKELVVDFARRWDAKVIVQYDTRPSTLDRWSAAMTSADPDFDTWESYENLLLVQSVRTQPELAYEELIQSFDKSEYYAQFAHKLRYARIVTRDGDSIEGGDWRSSAPTGARLGVRVGFPADWTVEMAQRAVREAVQRVTSALQVPATIEEIDISADPALEARYGLEIPVLLVDGRKAAKYRVTEEELTRLLRSRHG